MKDESLEIAHLTSRKSENASVSPFLGGLILQCYIITRKKVTFGMKSAVFVTGNVFKLKMGGIFEDYTPMNKSYFNDYLISFYILLFSKCICVYDVLR